MPVATVNDIIDLAVAKAEEWNDQGISLLGTASAAIGTVVTPITKFPVFSPPSSNNYPQYSVPTTSNFLSFVTPIDSPIYSASAASPVYEPPSLLGTNTTTPVDAVQEFTADEVVTDDDEGKADIALFRELLLELQTKAVESLALYFVTYFPNMDSGLQLLTKAEEWLQQAIDLQNGGGTGIRPELENATWQRDRDRLTKEALVRKRTAMEQWATRGFAMPTGFIAYHENEAVMALNSEIGASSRAAAVTSINAELENVREAQKQIINYRLASLKAASEYIETILTAPQDVAARLAMDRDKHKADLTSAAAAYYNARTNARQLAFQVGKWNMDAQMQVDKWNLDLLAEAGKFNIGSKLQVGKWDMDSRITIGTSNMDSKLKVGTSNQDARLRAGIANLDAINALVQLEYQEFSRRIPETARNAVAAADLAARTAGAAMSSINAIGQMVIQE